MIDSSSSWCWCFSTLLDTRGSSRCLSSANAWSCSCRSNVTARAAAPRRRRSLQTSVVQIDMSSGGFCHVHYVRVHGAALMRGRRVKINKLSALQNAFLLFTCVSEVSCYCVCLGESAWPHALRCTTGFCTRQAKVSNGEPLKLKPRVLKRVSILTLPCLITKRAWTLVKLEKKLIKKMNLINYGLWD